jgi:hypothetical protein
MVLIGSPLQASFEDSPYSQLEGFWLHCRMRLLRADVDVYAVSRAQLVDQELVFDAYDRAALRRRTLVLPLEQTIVYDWFDPDGIPRIASDLAATKESSP